MASKIAANSDAGQESQQKTEPALEKSSNDGIVPQKKLSYKLQRELDAIPERIDALETELAALHEQTNQVDFYQQSIDVTEAVLANITAAQEQLDALIERWAELDS